MLNSVSTKAFEESESKHAAKETNKQFEEDFRAWVASYTNKKNQKVTIIDVRDFNADVSAAKAAAVMPGPTTLSKDEANNRWLLKWLQPWRTLPSCSRSWSCRGKNGVVLALKEVAENAWADYAKVTGQQCPHNLTL